MRWLFRSQTLLNPPPEAELAERAGQLEISPLLARILWQRGLHGFEAMRAFLNPSLQGLAPLEDWPGLTRAAEVLAASLLGGCKLCVWGDYDVDGITATALVLDFLAAHGFSAQSHIPDRIGEGYGLNKQGISQLAAQGVNLLLTVDCGISDHEAVAHAKALGMTVIVSDHHLPAETLPPADALVNPRLADCPCPALAGVGVAFLLMAALNNALVRAGRTRYDVRRLLDLVALGTLADVVDLNGQNRILVKNGLLKIAGGDRVGIAALKTACNFAPNAALGAGQVVFTLAPRINAAGRLGSSMVALELLLTEDRGRAADLAAELSRLNAERREEEERILTGALLQAEQQAQAGRMGLVLHSPDWHPGIIGIVASRVVERLHRPAVVLCSTGAFLKGSGRSVPGFDMHEAFSRCSDFFLGFGGHTMAAGLSLESAMLAPFRERFNQLAAQGLGGSPVEAECKIDGDLGFEAVDFQFLKELEMLQPFGMGNPEPVFASPPVRIKNMRGRPGFMLLDLEDESSGRTLQAKAWRQLADIPATLRGKRIRIAYTPRIDRYNGAATVELRLKDWKEA
ncbi:single-stranded-DNA-specific exonuclease RecJ [Desulfovibrio sp. OttesenSCG-928-F20]|nr:single-stranded-DNA-specific exonuclease RecJ [Desulfovibrio sp. OttesenSCG-928-M16]MDL2291001.1 single-stranded-DNA-specific exonuclease RecJ [Desulfovibrio sp. OttesenSCG-928-F20]